jgi:hypothetical protein
MIPVFAIDRMLEKHMQALRRSGYPEWGEGGTKLFEWMSRQEYVYRHRSRFEYLIYSYREWKKGAAERQAEARRQTSRRRPFRMGWLDPDDPMINLLLSSN